MNASESLENRFASGVKVALVHDWLTGMRGGEKVLDVLCSLFPHAELWTLLHNKGSVSRNIENRPIHASLLQRLPGAAKRYRSYLPLFPLCAETNKARGAELVLSTSHAVAKAMVRRRRGNAPLHICYIHTPMRYIWDLFDEYFGPERVGKWASRFVFAPVASAMRRYDRATVGRVDLFLANSTYVAERVRRIYGREAVVLPPPVAVGRYAAVERAPGADYLVISALVPYKRVEHAIEACARLGRGLTIVGQGPEQPRLEARAKALGARVTFAGFASDEQLGSYYGQARALLFPGVEDFGIVPVEAIACGCPVIALGEGGILDSMTAETAHFYQSPTVDALEAAMRSFEEREHTFRPEVLRERAQTFSEEQFIVRLTSIVDHVLAANPRLIRTAAQNREQASLEAAAVSPPAGAMPALLP